MTISPVLDAAGGRRRQIGMDDWGFEQLRPWLAARVELPIGPLFGVIDGPTRGRPWSSANVRVEFRRLAADMGIRRRFAPHQLRHAHAVELAREGLALDVIQRQLGHYAGDRVNRVIQGPGKSCEAIVLPAWSSSATDAGKRT